MFHPAYPTIEAYRHLNICITIPHRHSINQQFPIIARSLNEGCVMEVAIAVGLSRSNHNLLPSRRLKIKLNISVDETGEQKRIGVGGAGLSINRLVPCGTARPKPSVNCE